MDAQRSWHRSAAALPAALGFPGGCFLNFLPRIFVLWYSLEVNNSLSHTYLIGTQFCFGCKENFVLALNQCSALSFPALQRQGGQCSRGLGAGTAPSPHPFPLPGAANSGQDPGLPHPAHPEPSFSMKASSPCIPGAAGFPLLCFLFFSTPGEIYCCKAPWAHWQGKTITQHFQSQRSVIVIYLCAPFQHSPVGWVSSFQFHTGVLMPPVLLSLHVRALSRLLHSRITFPWSDRSQGPGTEAQSAAEEPISSVFLLILVLFKSHHLNKIFSWTLSLV